MSRTTSGVRADTGLGWTVVGLVLLAVNLRPAIGSVSPLLGEIQQTLGLSDAAISIITTLPVLCLGLFATIAPALARRLGTQSTLVLGLSLIVVGLLVRLVPTAVTLFGGTVLAGAGLAIGNVLVPVVIKQSFPDRVRLFTGLSTALLSGGAALASGTTIPLQDGLGLSWPGALALWAVPAAVALVVWAALAVRAGRPAQNARGGGSLFGSLIHDATAWQATGYLSLRALAFFTALGWLPTVLVAAGFERVAAGGLLSLTMFVSIPAAVIAPVLTGRVRPGPVVVVVAVIGTVANLGLVLWPAVAGLWAVLLGISLGGGFAMAMTFISLRSPDPATAVRLSSMVQTIGYLVGAVVGPLVFGLLGSATGGWTAPLVLLMILALPELLIGLLVSRDRQVRAVGQAPSAPTPVAPGGGGTS